MQRSTRRVILFFAILTFLAASYIVVQYAEGYKYSFADNRFVRSGALYVRVNAQAELLVNGVIRDQTSFLTNSASVGGLLPGTYTVRVQKDGYSTWEKRVTIEEGFVQDFQKVMLLPTSGQDQLNVEKEITTRLYPPVASASHTPSSTKTPQSSPKLSPSPVISAQPTPYPTTPFFINKDTLYVQGLNGAAPQPIALNIKSAYLSDDGQKLMWFNGTQVWVYWISNTNYQPFHIAGDIALVTSFKNQIRAANWFRDSDHIVVDTGTSTKSAFKITEIDQRGGLNIISY